MLMQVSNFGQNSCGAIYWAKGPKLSTPISKANRNIKKQQKYDGCRRISAVFHGMYVCVKWKQNSQLKCLVGP